MPIITKSALERSCATYFQDSGIMAWFRKLFLTAMMRILITFPGLIFGRHPVPPMLLGSTILLEFANSPFMQLLYCFSLRVQRMRKRPKGLPENYFKK